MTPEDKQALQVAITLRYGIKCPTCTDCKFAEPSLLRVDDRGETTGGGISGAAKYFCRFHERRVDSNDLCRNYSPEEWLIYGKKVRRR